MIEGRQEREFEEKVIFPENFVSIQTGDVKNAAVFLSSQVKVYLGKLRRQYFCVTKKNALPS